MDAKIGADLGATAAPPDDWALVEIFGHRQHYGRVSEVERFGAKMLRVDVPADDPDEFETHYYGGSSIFSMTPCSEGVARAYNERYRPHPVAPVTALPPPAARTFPLSDGEGAEEDDWAGSEDTVRPPPEEDVTMSGLGLADHLGP